VGVVAILIPNAQFDPGVQPQVISVRQKHGQLIEEHALMVKRMHMALDYLREDLYGHSHRTTHNNGPASKVCYMYPNYQNQVHAATLPEV
jgi:hypothetical protein